MPAGDLSEFTFGFAYTYELATLWKDHLIGSPLIPNQVDEGRAGGGFDVALNSTNNFIYFAQFKLSAYISHYWLAKQAGFGEEFYRFKVYGSKASKQHELLRALETGGNIVEYVAPRFHTKAELDPLYVAATVRNQSYRIHPSKIGALPDEDDHAVVFSTSGLRQALFSEPRYIVGAVNAGQIIESGFAPAPARVNARPEETTLESRLGNAQGLLLREGRISDAVLEREADLLSRVRLARENRSWRGNVRRFDATGVRGVQVTQGRVPRLLAAQGITGL